ncbi:MULTISPECIES: sensor domain-containing diguanylate cyclase [Halomonadaceae]|uniref:diguanylate cyclase n=1 Tax=Vreelandella halophila TaxID=86177 RepID=A0A9X4Y9F9_9GAMM|nr:MULTISPECIES: diguanylate cyclase [Halomonas]MYL25230.1 diguanylate cyclase [Halomonas utahensis]MYL75292.1 diguanylate cyclase [Halomonas sp. 22501_18_FS]
METALSQLAHSVASAVSLEGLVRPMLDLIQQATGLDSVYLTMYRPEDDSQEIIYARNTGALTLKEGLRVPWQDTLCRRALTENRLLTQDVPNTWGDSLAARRLGIQTYVTVPVRRLDDGLLGTLCGASSRSVEIADTSLATLRLCADLIAHQITREEHAHSVRRQALEAEQQIQRMGLISEVSRLCLSASRLHDAVAAVAARLEHSHLWERVIPLYLRDDGHARTLGEKDPEATRLADALMEANPEHLEGMLHSDHEHLIFPPEDMQWVREQRRREALPEDGDAALLVITSDEKAEAAILILSAHDLNRSPDERQLLNSVANALSLLANRLLDHARLEAANLELKHNALHDTLTGLPNRRYLIQELERLLAQAQRVDGAVHVAFIDLDGFKRINDTHGHEVGDEFLRQFAVQLRNLSRMGDMVARYGGDEFVFVGKPGAGGDPAHERSVISERLRTGTRGTYELESTTIEYNGPSVGVVTWRAGDVADADVVLARADEAMYADKQARRSAQHTRHTGD